MLSLETKTTQKSETLSAVVFQILVFCFGIQAVYKMRRIKSGKNFCLANLENLIELSSLWHVVQRAENS